MDKFLFLVTRNKKHLCTKANFPLTAKVEITRNLTLDANFVTHRRIVHRRFTIADVRVENDDEIGQSDLDTNDDTIDVAHDQNDDQNVPSDLDGNANDNGDSAQPLASNVAPAQPSLLNINRRDKTFMKRRKSSKI